MPGAIRQRGHYLEREFPTLQSWSKNLVLIYIAERMHQLDPGGYDPSVWRVRVSKLSTELRRDASGCFRYRVKLYLNNGYNYRLEWKRSRLVGQFFDVWERVPWSGRGKGKGSVVRTRSAALRGAEQQNLGSVQQRKL